MRTEQEIRDRIRELERDPRHAYPPANVAVNAPIALEQISIRSQIAILRWVLENPNTWEKLPEPFTITDISPEWSRSQI
jgi:hypothetical protein